MKKYIAAVIVLAILAGSGVAFAHFSNNSPVVNWESSPKKVETIPPDRTDEKASVEPKTKTEISGPCTTTTTSDMDNTPPNTHNNTTTTTECHSSGVNSSSVNITNNSSQNATSGSVNNTDNTSTNTSQY